MSAEQHEHCEHHHHEIAAQVGNLCCQGLCSHPEHQQFNQLYEQQRLLEEQLQAIEYKTTAPNKPEVKKKDKKSKRRQFGWMALRAA